MSEGVSTKDAIARARLRSLLKSEPGSSDPTVVVQVRVADIRPSIMTRFRSERWRGSTGVVHSDTSSNQTTQ
jgi:hypothetical protein